MTEKSKRPQLRESVISDLPLGKYLAVKAFEAGKNNTMLAGEIGYERANVVAMIMGGTMKLPIPKVPVVAHSLNIDAIHLLRRVMNESSPEVWATIESVMDGQLLTRNERKLISAVREATNGADIDFTEDGEFIDGLKANLEKLAVAHQRDMEGLAQIAAKTSPTQLAKLTAEERKAPKAIGS